jgi:hypothetical protein
MAEHDYFAAAVGKMRGLSLSIALAGVLALGASQTAVFAADIAAREVAPRGIHTKHWRATTHWRAARRVAIHRCIEVSQPARGCPLRRYSLLPWPSIPRCYLYDGACVYHTAPDLEEWDRYGF